MSGLAKAEYAMGYFTEVGIGAPANLEDAKRWYWRAAGMFSLIPFHPLIYLS
jgi:TPR repeat protein